jgi:hypothetical protein
MNLGELCIEQPRFFKMLKKVSAMRDDAKNDAQPI